MECYICYENETQDNPFVDINICKCKGSNRLHIKCFQKLPDQNKCSICKAFFNLSDDLYEKENGMRVIKETDKYGFTHRYTINNKGEKHGKYCIYYLNGNIWEEQLYDNGIRNGIQKLYSTNGENCYDKIYIKGVPM